MSEIYELKIVAEGFATDAEGRPLDAEGNLINPSDPESSEDETDTKEDPK